MPQVFLLLTLLPCFFMNESCFDEAEDGDWQHDDAPPMTPPRSAAAVDLDFDA